MKILPKRKKGIVYTFPRFVDTLIKLSYLYVRRSEELMAQIELPSETFILLLEKLELSKGFLNLEKRTNKPHISQTSLLPSQEVVDMIEDA